MKLKNWLALLVSLCLLCCLVLPVFAEGEDAPDPGTEPGTDSGTDPAPEPDQEPGFTDIGGHWAKKYINRAVSLGLFKGTSDTTFSPDEPMTRAMFVTVLGRLADVNGSEWKVSYLTNLFRDVKTRSYYAPYVSWAIHRGITNGTGAKTFSPDDYVTREQVAAFVGKFLTLEGYSLSTASDMTVEFTDAGKIARWARDSVRTLAAAKILNGIKNSAGGFRFEPKKNATRAECATIFCRLIDAMVPPEQALTEPEGILIQEALVLKPGDTVSLAADLIPDPVDHPNVIWYGTDDSVLHVSLQGKITAVASGTAEVWAVCCNRRSACCTVTVEAPQQNALANGDMSYQEKLIFVYGTTDVAEYRTYYATEVEAKTNQELITVHVWEIQSDGSKADKTRTFRVHRNLAPTVEAIFAEIFALPEQPPIHSASGWRWRSWEKSEHNMGLAIDVNPAENPYVAKGSDPYAAGYRPGEDPYSIPIGGSVDQIFAKYGFTRGIYWNNGNRDYMHYSFFGT